MVEATSGERGWALALKRTAEMFAVVRRPKLRWPTTMSRGEISSYGSWFHRVEPLSERLKRLRDQELFGRQISDRVQAVLALYGSNSSYRGYREAFLALATSHPDLRCLQEPEPRPMPPDIAGPKHQPKNPRLGDYVRQMRNLHKHERMTKKRAAMRVVSDAKEELRVQQTVFPSADHPKPPTVAGLLKADRRFPELGLWSPELDRLIESQRWRDRLHDCAPVDIYVDSVERISIALKDGRCTAEQFRAGMGALVEARLADVSEQSRADDDIPAKFRS